MKKSNADNGRKYMRLYGYDYSWSGLYFLTLCVKNRLHLFGEICNGSMILNDAGRMIEKWYYEIENKYLDKKCHEKIVMPNHFHCVIENLNVFKNKDAYVDMPQSGQSITDLQTTEESLSESKYGMHNKVIGASIGSVMDWFKTMTTNDYIRGVKQNEWQRFDGKLWQRDYYDHIIRNEQDDARISEYIVSNPLRWDDDTFNS